ncbi:hypothetical protein V8F20_004502 [Naviculisporaceae sp. PSN 640]
MTTSGPIVGGIINIRIGNMRYGLGERLPEVTDFLPRRFHSANWGRVSSRSGRRQKFWVSGKASLSLCAFPSLSLLGGYGIHGAVKGFAFQTTWWSLRSSFVSTSDLLPAEGYLAFPTAGWQVLSADWEKPQPAGQGGANGRVVKSQARNNIRNPTQFTSDVFWMARQESGTKTELGENWGFDHPFQYPLIHTPSGTKGGPVQRQSQPPTNPRPGGPAPTV